MKSKYLCMNVNCKNNFDIIVNVKVLGGKSLVTKVCFKHIRKALIREGAEFVMWNCAPIKNGRG